MPPTIITPVQATNRHSQSGFNVPMVNIDGTNGNDFVASMGLNLIIVTNPSASPRNFTIASQPDPVYGRLGDVNLNIESLATRVFPLTFEGWADPATSKIIITGHSSLQIGVLKLF